MWPRILCVRRVVAPQSDRPSKHASKRASLGVEVVRGLANRLHGKLLEVVNVLAKRLVEPSRLGVVDVVLLARVLHNLPDVREVAVIDAREEVMLNLEVQSTREKERGPSENAVVHERVRRHDLVLVEVAV